MSKVCTTSTASDAKHTCEWSTCSLNFPTASDLYDHITTLHIGRKSAGTLSLECKWGSCTSKASKRDHLTSHVRVHIDLKPHACGICGKAFKRPQDLKKHEKIHTEEHHVNHKHSKAFTVNPPKVEPAQPTNPENTSQPSALSVPQVTQPGTQPGTQPLAQPGTQPGTQPGAQPGAQGNIAAAYPFSYPISYYPQLFHGLDVAQVLEQQRQLNAHFLAAQAQAAQAAVNGVPGFGVGNIPNLPNVPNLSNMGVHGVPSSVANVGMNIPALFPIQYPPTSFPNNQSISGLPVINLGYSYPFYGMGSVPLTTQGVPASVTPNGAHPVPTPTPNSTKEGSIYPALPFKGLSRSTSTDSSSSPDSSRESRESLSLSPRHLGSLSPASTDNSEERDEKEDKEGRGVKRSFSDAAGELFDDFRGKRFQEGDLDSQVEQIDALAMLLTNSGEAMDCFSPAHSLLEGGTSPADSTKITSAPTSEFNVHEVDSFNSMLANLAKNIEDYHPTSPQGVQPHAVSKPITQVPAGVVYPSLSQYDRHIAPLPSRHDMLKAGAMNQAPAGIPMGLGMHPISMGLNGMILNMSDPHGNNPMHSLSNTIAPPSIMNDFSRMPILNSVERLTRADDHRIREVDSDDGEIMRESKFSRRTEKSHSLFGSLSKFDSLLSAANEAADIERIAMEEDFRRTRESSLSASSSTASVVSSPSSAGSPTWSPSASQDDSSTSSLYPGPRLAPIVAGRHSSSVSLPHIDEMLRGVQNTCVDSLDTNFKEMDVDCKQDSDEEMASDLESDDSDATMKTSLAPPKLDESIKDRRLEAIKTLIVLVNQRFRESIARQTQNPSRTEVKVEEV